MAVPSPGEGEGERPTILCRSVSPLKTNRTDLNSTATVKNGNAFIRFGNRRSVHPLLNRFTNHSETQQPTRIISIKPIRTFAIILAGIALSLPTPAATVTAGDIPNNVSPNFTTGDGLLTLTGYSDSAFALPSNLTSSGPGSWFGVGGNTALDNTETMTLQLAPGVGLTGFGDIWTRAVITIAGFTSDPGLNIGANPGVLGSSHGAGVLTLNLDWNGGGNRAFTLAGPSASAGQFLRVSLDFATGPQWAVTHLDYAVVPEPSSLALLFLGAGFG